jgi:GNAT superfamily N-acetyltransferase
MDLREISPTDPVFPEAMQLYGASFPPVERKTESAIVALLQGGDYHLYVAIDIGTLVGLSALCLLKDLKMASLDYLAVAPFRRGMGLGTLLFKHALGQVALHIPGALGMLLEVQREDLAADSEERSLREARLRFYYKLGAKVITRSYFLPPQSGDVPEEMCLLILPTVSPLILDKDCMLKLVWALHSRVYCYGKRDLLRMTAKGLPEQMELL